MKFIAVLALFLALTNAVSLKGEFRPEDKDHGEITAGVDKIMQRNRDFINHDVMVNPR